ncbi:hypothetical protein NDU88_000440 [Pleurodeles waltl]|uniref:Ribonuclease A-domain domain-containing protein n=1 Tax=Pleurodeles waltl TaxID=8319 RepID=A0AAV7P125_PLEWA|nr:hypothetical protein NDU88_000440 [Pleurodeles waltl]
MSVLQVHLAVLLLVVASFTCAYQHCKPPPGETAYQQFLRQHRDSSDDGGGDAYCDKKMHERCMTNLDPPKTKCKEVNSFIRATTNQIKAICEKAGKHYDGRGDLTVSLQPFRVTTCKNRGDPNVHPCEYRGSTTTRKIVIGCRGGDPTHFEEGIVVPN